MPTGAAAAALNVTATGAVAPGYLTVFPCGSARPTASTLNYVPGASVANSTIAQLGSGGRICIYSLRTTNVIVDVNGYFPAGSSYRPAGPARLLDSRPGHSTVDGSSAGGGLRGAGSVTRLRVGGRAGVPRNAVAVALNVTATGASSNGYATVYPCDMPRPVASNLNFSAGTTIANAAISDLDNGGDVCIYTHRPTHVVADVTGYFTDASRYDPLDPARLLDSRPGHPTADGRFAGGGALSGGSTLQLPVTGRGGVPSNAGAVALNLTATGPVGDGYVTVYPCGAARPTASNLNFRVGATIAGAAISKVGSGGRVCLYVHRTTHLVVDVAGAFTPRAAFVSLVPARLVDTRPRTPVEVAENWSKIHLDELRASMGRGAVTLDPTMSAFARNWSVTMSASGFRHSGGPWAENIGYWGAPWLTPEEAAAGLHRSWVESPPHFANMTNGDWTYVGIGFHHSPSGWYATHEFRN